MTRYGCAFLVALLLAATEAGADIPVKVLARAQSPIDLRSCYVSTEGRDRRIVGARNYYSLEWADGTDDDLYAVFSNLVPEAAKSVVLRFDEYDSSGNPVRIAFAEINGTFSSGVVIDDTHNMLMWRVWMPISVADVQCSVEGVRFVDNSEWILNPAIRLDCMPAYDERYSRSGSSVPVLEPGSLTFRLCNLQGSGSA